MVTDDDSSSSLWMPTVLSSISPDKNGRNLAAIRILVAIDRATQS